MENLSGEVATLTEWVNDPNRVIIAHLFKNAITPDADKIALADLVEANFPGYAPARIVGWDPRIFDDDLYGEVTSGPLEFLGVDLADSQLIYGQYLTVSEPNMSTRLWWAIPYSEPSKISPSEPLLVCSWRISSCDIQGADVPPWQV